MTTCKTSEFSSHSGSSVSLMSPRRGAAIVIWVARRGGSNLKTVTLQSPIEVAARRLPRLPNRPEKVLLASCHPDLLQDAALRQLRRRAFLLLPARFAPLRPRFGTWDRQYTPNAILYSKAGGCSTPCPFAASLLGVNLLALKWARAKQRLIGAISARMSKHSTLSRALPRV